MKIDSTPVVDALSQINAEIKELPPLPESLADGDKEIPQAGDFQLFKFFLTS